MEEDFNNSFLLQNASLQNTVVGERHELFLGVVTTFLLISVSFNTFSILVITKSDIFNDLEGLLIRFLGILDMVMITFIWLVLMIGVHIFYILIILGTCLSMTYVLANTIVACRYIMIMKPLHYHRYLSRTKVITVQVCLDGLSFFVLLLLQLLCDLVAYLQFLTRFCIVMIAGGLLFQLITCLHILHTSVKQARQIRALLINVNRQAGSHEADLQERQYHGNGGNAYKGVRTIMVIIWSYWIVWIPILIYPISAAGFLQLTAWFNVFAMCTTGLGTCWNPLIFYVTNKPFRNAANDFFRKIKNML